MATSLSGRAFLFASCSSSSSVASARTSSVSRCLLCQSHFPGSHRQLLQQRTFSLSPLPSVSDQFFGVRCKSSSSSAGQMENLVKEKNAQNPVVVYSKSWCPYCSQVKELFRKLGVQPLVVELDELVDEAELQGVLKTLTGQSTVPNVFIGGMHIGGCDDTMDLHRSKKLLPLLEKAGAKFSQGS